MSKSDLYKDMPDSPGVYLMKDKSGEILYVGKAANLKRRVSSYFLKAHDARIEKLVSEIRKIDHKETDTALEALILEAELIKRHAPPYNIREKDDKSFLYVEITKEKFPRVLLVRGKEVDKDKKGVYGPFISGSAIREALRIIRKIFPYNIHPMEKIGTYKRPCFDYQVGLCPGTCVYDISRKDYLDNVKNIKLIFGGNKKRIIYSLEKEMMEAGKKLEFEKAAKLKRKIFALNHINDIALINSEDSLRLSRNDNKKTRIEGYDISNISGDSAVGGMVVFENGEPNKNEYRKFKIRTIIGANDVGMMEEVIRRRINNPWPLPDLILVDGGKAQVNVAEAVLEENGLRIPVVGIAKGTERKRNDVIGKIPKSFDIETLIRVRDEAHRYSIRYHRDVRDRNFI